MSPKNRLPGLAAALVAAAGLLASSPTAVFGDRPSAPHLLPENTVAYLRIHDTQELIEKYKETSMGRALRDKEVLPFVQHLYGSASDSFQRIEDRLGLSLEELLAIPQGEICVALVAPKEGRPGLVVLVEVGDQLPAARQLVERLEAEMERRGATRTTEQLEDTQLTILAPPGRRNRRIVLFERDETIAVVTDVELAKQLLAVWQGAQAETMADNRRFTAIMGRCAGASNERPQLTYFADPVALVQSLGSGNTGLQVALAMLEPLGLDGLQGVGGSMILGDDQFESVSHLHILLHNPPDGVLELLALQPGDVTPEPWVPNDVSAYITVNWNFDQTFSTLKKLYDRFRGEDAFSEDVQRRLGKPLGLDFEKEVMAAVGGRFTLLTRMEKPARLNSQTTMIGVKLKDAEAFRPTFDRILARGAKAFVKDTYVDQTYYHVRSQKPPRDFDEDVMRLPNPCAAILGDYLLLADSSELLKRAILTKKGSSPPLRDELDYKLIASKIQRQAGGAEPNMISFSRPEESLRAFYEFARADTTRTRLAEQAKKNPLLKALYEAMSEHPLPPFEVVAKYFAPTGEFVSSDETGIHFMGFSLKRE